MLSHLGVTFIVLGFAALLLAMPISTVNAKNLLSLLLPQKLFVFSEVMLETLPPKFPSETSKKTNLVRLFSIYEVIFCLTRSLKLGRGEKTPTPKTRFSISTLLRTPGRFTARPLPVYFTTKLPVVRPFFGP